jgi:pheromone shutdown protein TraB
MMKAHADMENAGYPVGNEFVCAAVEAGKVRAAVILGDQDAAITLQRVTIAMNKTDPAKLQEIDQIIVTALQQKIAELEDRGLLEQVLAHVDFTSIDIENTSDEQGFQISIPIWELVLADRQSVSKLVEEANTIAPAAVQAILSDRDEYMANGLLNSASSIRAWLPSWGSRILMGSNRN